MGTFDKYNRTELILLTRAFGLGGDRRASVEELKQALEGLRAGKAPLPLPDKITRIRSNVMRYITKRWRVESYRLGCPAKEDPNSCISCSDGQVLACYLFGNNKVKIDDLAEEAAKND